MKKRYTFVSILIAIVMWLLDSTVHHLFFGEAEFEFIPGEVNELWMRSTIIILVICFGIYVDHQTNKILDTEKEKHRIYLATVSASQHILNNLLNNMQYFKIKIEESDACDQETKILFEKSITEAESLVAKLSTVEELTEDRIKDSVYPKSTK